MSAADFERIPECVYRLFDEIMSGDLRMPPVYEPAPFDRAGAYMMAWGWNPPLLLERREILSQYGLAAYSWNRDQHESPAPKEKKEPAAGTADARALAHYLESVKRGKPLTKKALAKLVGCCEKNLQPKRAPFLTRAMEQYKAKPQNLRSAERLRDRDCDDE